MKTKLVQNVNRMSERQKDMPKDRLTDGQTEDKTTFQPSNQNKSCSECQQKTLCQYVNMSICQYVRKLLFSLGMKMEVVQNIILFKIA